MDSWKCYKKTYSDLMNTLRSSSRSDLLQIKGLGPTKVDRIMEIRDSVAREGRPLRMRDVINLNRIGLGTLTEDPNAVDIAKYIAYYESEFSIDKKLHTMHYPDRVISIDFGTVNSAYTLIDSGYRVLKWKMMDFTWPQPFSPENLYNNVKKSLEALPAADAYILERQTSRTPTNQGILGISLELQCLETMTYALLRNRGTLVHSIGAKQVAKYFGTSATTSAQKKKNAVKLAQEMVEKQRPTPLGRRVGVSEEELRYFQSARKKDDLSDSLLGSLTVLDWSHMCQGLDNYKSRSHKKIV